MNTNPALGVRFNSVGRYLPIQICGLVPLSEIINIATTTINEKYIS